MTLLENIPAEDNKITNTNDQLESIMDERHKYKTAYDTLKEK